MPLVTYLTEERLKQGIDIIIRNANPEKIIAVKNEI